MLYLLSMAVFQDERLKINIIIPLICIYNSRLWKYRGNISFLFICNFLRLNLRNSKYYNSTSSKDILSIKVIVNESACILQNSPIFLFCVFCFDTMWYWHYSNPIVDGFLPFTATFLWISKDCYVEEIYYLLFFNSPENSSLFYYLDFDYESLKYH